MNAIEASREQGHFERASNDTCLPVETWNDLRSALLELRERRKRERWIPVEERLPEIDKADAVAEGAGLYGSANVKSEEFGHTMPGAVYQFAKLWDSINAKRGFGWAENPWVWVVEFRVLPTEDR